MRASGQLAWVKVFLGVLAVFLGSIVGIGSGHAETVKSWAVIASVADRFVVLSSYNNEAVLDRETGLVWLKKPMVRTDETFWFLAMEDCASNPFGGRFGWRLPSRSELGSLMMDNGNGESGTGILPPGHPFVFTSFSYEPYGYGSALTPEQLAGKIMFTSTTETVASLVNWAKTINLNFEGGNILMSFNSIKKDEATGFNQGVAWCVRGGSGYNGGI